MVGKNSSQIRINGNHSKSQTRTYELKTKTNLIILQVVHRTTLNGLSTEYHQNANLTLDNLKKQNNEK